MSVGRSLGQHSCDIIVTKTFFWPPRHLRDKEGEKKKKRKQADKESDGKPRMTEFNKVQQGRKDCTSAEKQRAFTTCADLNTFAPSFPASSPPFISVCIHPLTGRKADTEGDARSAFFFIWMLTEDGHHLCKRAAALRHLPAVNISPSFCSQIIHSFQIDCVCFLFRPL